jgi:hypothetical protein
MTPESTETTETPVPTEVPEDEDQAIVEEVSSDEEKTPDEPIPPKMKSIVVDEWVQLNAQPPLWARFVSHWNGSSCLLTRFPVIPKTSPMVGCVSHVKGVMY